MPQLLLSRIEASLEKNKNAANVPWMEAYMKNNFVFYGIKKPTLNIVFTAYKNEIKQLPTAAFWELIQQLWLKPQREFHYFAMLALLGYKKNLQQKDLLTLEWLLTQHAWWDSVDLLATHLVGAYFKKFPEDIEPTLQKWIDSQNLWLIRTCIIFQLKYKTNTNAHLLFSLCSLFKDSNEFFIQKATGWALRTYADVEPNAVIHFVQNHPLKPLSKREALRKIKD